MDPGCQSVAEERSFDKAALRELVLRLAARIKSDKPWPEQPFLCKIEGFKVWAGVTPEKGFRKVVITLPEAAFPPGCAGRCQPREGMQCGKVFSLPIRN